MEDKKRENKVEVVQNLETLLKSTREFSDIDHLSYVEMDRGEFVLVYFKNRTYSDPDYTIEVTWDSGIAIVMDVLRKIY